MNFSEKQKLNTVPDNYTCNKVVLLYPSKVQVFKLQINNVIHHGLKNQQLLLGFFFIYIIFQVIYLALENKFLVENNFPNRKLIFPKEFLKILEKCQFSIYMNETLKVLLYQIGNFKFIEENYLEVNVLSDSQLLFFYRKD